MPIISTTLIKQIISLKYTLPKLIQETGNLNNPIFTKEIEFVIKNFPKKTAPGLNSFPEEFYKTL